MDFGVTATIRNWIAMTGVCGILALLVGCSAAPSPSDSSEKETPAMGQTIAGKGEGISPRRQQTTVSNKVTGLPFTLDAYLGRLSELQAVESLGEFRSSQKFSCDFMDGSGTIVGEYSIPDRKLKHLTITGTGAIYTRSVEQAIFLSLQGKHSEDIAALFDRINSKELSDYSTTIDHLTFTFSTLANQAIFSLRNANDTPKSQNDLKQEYVAPTIGVSLPAFKKEFNARMSRLNQRLLIKGSGEETTSAAYFEYMFTKNTVLHVYANEEMQIETVELDGDQKDGALFWLCADATLAGLHPQFSVGKRNAILERISGGRRGFPAINTEFDDGKLQYNCQLIPYTSGCALTIQSNQP